MPTKSKKRVKTSAVPAAGNRTNPDNKTAKKKINLKVKVKKSKVKKTKTVLLADHNKEKTEPRIKNGKAEFNVKKTGSIKNAAKPSNNKLFFRENKKEDIEKDKQLIMWSGVIFFMILIMFFWIYNTKKIFNQTRTESKSNFSLTEWREAADDIGDRMNRLKNDLDKIKNFEGSEITDTAQNNETIIKLKEKLLNSTSTDVGADDVAGAEATKKEISELKKKLEELENKINQ